MDISELRTRINEIDEQLASLFTERMYISAKIGEYKYENGIEIRDPKREQEIIDNLSSKAGKIYSPYIKALYSDIFDMSRRLQTQLHEINSIEYGLIGQNVAYSYNKWIHHALENRSYGLYNISEEMLPLLFSKRAFKGLNVSTPYRKEVLKYCDIIDPAAEEIGYIDTIVKNPNGTLTGYNTAAEAIAATAKKADISFKGKKVMILGTGGFAAAALKAVKDSEPESVITVSRTGKVNFRNYTQHSDVEIVINATSIGMNPNSDISPVDLAKLPDVCGVIDAVFTPVESRLIKEAKERDIKCENGLSILIEKCVRSSKLFGFEPDANATTELYEELTSFIE